MLRSTGGLADVRTIRPAGTPRIRFPEHDGELVFGFVLGGTADLELGDRLRLANADAFVIPPGKSWRLTGFSPDFRLLHVTTARLD